MHNRLKVIDFRTLETHLVALENHRSRLNHALGIHSLAAMEAGDSSAARVLRVKSQIGLFDEPFGDPDSAAWWNGHPEHLVLARRAAAAASVLLANDGTLPLPPSIGSVALIGRAE